MTHSAQQTRKHYDLNCGHGRLIAIGSDEELYAKESGTACCNKCRDYSAIVGWIAPTDAPADDYDDWK